MNQNLKQRFIHYMRLGNQEFFLASIVLFLGILPRLLALRYLLIYLYFKLQFDCSTGQWAVTSLDRL